MKKKYYGNYLGIVVTGAHSDPENRGRCQIFIPHISNTLYKKWNKLNKDISFAHLDPSVFTSDILQDLKLSLPWAECAAPLFGGGTSGFYNPATEKIGVNLADSTNPSSSTNPTQNSQDFPKIQPAAENSNYDPEVSQNFIPLKNSIATQSEVGGYETPWAVVKNPGESFYSIGPRQYITTPGGSWDQFLRGPGSSYASQFSGLTIGSTEFKNKLKELGNDPNFARAYESLHQNSMQPTFNNLQKSGLNINQYPGLYEFYDSQYTQKRSLAEKALIDAYNSCQNCSENDLINRFASVLQDRAPSHLRTFRANGGNYESAGPQRIERERQQALALASGQQIPSPNIQDAKANPDPDYTSISSGNTASVSGYGSANGFFALPREGAKLWVFFLGGDIQKPVYFAMQPEPISIRQFTQAASPPSTESIPKDPSNPYNLQNYNSNKIDNSFNSNHGFFDNGSGLLINSKQSIGSSNVPHDESRVLLSSASGTVASVGTEGFVVRDSKGNVIAATDNTVINSIGKVDITSTDEINLYAPNGVYTKTGDHSEKTQKYLQEEQKVVNDIAKQQESAIKGGSEDVTCPICEQKLADDKSDFIARILRTLQKISNLLPWDCWNWGVTQFLINFIAIPMLSEVSVLFMSGGEGCGMCKSGKVKSYQKGIEKANQEGAKNFAEKSKQLSEKAKGVKIGANVQSTMGSWGINAGGPNINNAPCAVKVKDDTSLYPTKLKKSNKTSANVLYPAGEKTETVVYVMPNKTSAGDITLQSANDIKMLAGSPGIQMETQGKTSIKSGFVEILAGDGPAVLSSNNVTSVTSSTGKVVIEGKQGVSIGSNTYVQGNLGISGNLGIKGSITLDGLVATKHLICKSMRSTTTSGSSPKACSNSATWFTEGATAVDIFDKTKNLILRDLSLKMYLLTPKGLVTFFQEILDSVLLNIGMEPTVTGIGFGFGVVTVFNFTHTHQLVSQDHSHDIDMPQWQRAGDNKAWANMAPDPSAEAPIPAPSQGDDPPGGPKAPTSCGGGGFGFGGGSNSSRRRANRNARFGVPTGSTDYSRITPQGYFNNVTFRTVSTNLTGISGDKITVVTDLSGNQITIYTDISGNEFTLNNGTLTGTRVYIDTDYTPNNQKWTYDPSGNIYPRDIVRFSISEDCI